MGNLRKMRSEHTDPVAYTLQLGDCSVLLNEYLGKKIQLKYVGTINCIHCGRKTSKSFQQGYCFPCFRQLQDCNLCQIHPEKCRFYEGRCDPENWVHASCGQPHVVYLANTSALKVGITRVSQVPTRWIDQGATQALIIAKVSNRHLAGLVEVAFKAYVSDKTNWRTMLSGANDGIDLVKHRDKLQSQAEQMLAEIQARYKPKDIIFECDETIYSVNYPVVEYPHKVNSLSLDKTSEIEGVLLGIKGQYLILDTGVINIRKFSGYQVEFQSY